MFKFNGVCLDAIILNLKTYAQSYLLQIYQIQKQFEDKIQDFS